MNKMEIVYVISDSVGETAEFVVKAVATQFNGGQVDIRRNSYVKSEEDIDEITAEEMITNSDDEQVLNNNITNIENEDKSEITDNQ